MKYEKDKEDKRVSNIMKVVDAYGNEITGAISFDTDTGIVEVWEPENYGDGGKLVKRTKYHPNAMAIIDDIARPDDTQLGDIRQKHTGRRDR
jgi:hypothetical protein